LASSLKIFALKKVEMPVGTLGNIAISYQSGSELFFW